MTAISNVLCKHYIACASDSFIAPVKQDAGDDEPLEYVEVRKPKIVPLDGLKGAVSYWGFAGQGSISTLEELSALATRARSFASLDAFAHGVRDHFNELFRTHPAIRRRHRGVGFHVVGYEDVEGIPVPELFLATNFKGIDYYDLYDEIGCSRRSYLTVPPGDPGDDAYLTKHAETPYRKKLYDYLQGGHILYFNNGDPELFTNAANGVLESMRALSERSALKEREYVWRDLATQPIEIVKGLQASFARKGHRMVGGKVHDLVILPDGKMYSDSGVLKQRWSER